MEKFLRFLLLLIIVATIVQWWRYGMPPEESALVAEAPVPKIHTTESLAPPSASSRSGATPSVSVTADRTPTSSSGTRVQVEQPAAPPPAQTGPASHTHPVSIMAIGAADALKATQEMAQRTEGFAQNQLAGKLLNIWGNGMQTVLRDVVAKGTLNDGSMDPNALKPHYSIVQRTKKPPTFTKQ